MKILDKIMEIIYSVYCECYLKPKMKKKLVKASEKSGFSEKFTSELLYLKENGICFVPYRCLKQDNATVSFDNEKHLFFADVFGKKLYLKAGVSKKQAMWNIRDLLIEQDEASPHLYIDKDDSFFSNKDVILIDAGSAEGNFTLEHIDKCKKVHLIEADCRWYSALNATFGSYSDKVEIINKFISDKTDDTYSALDDLFPDYRNEKIFIKMDLEGFGLNAIKGAKRLMEENNVFIANASYHYDEEYDEVFNYVTKNLPDYCVEPSKGYVLFWFDKNLKYPFFRRGMCRIRRKGN